MSIVINATSSSSYSLYNNMLNMLRPQKNSGQENAKLSAKSEEAKPAKLSKKDVKKQEAALSPEKAVDNIALSPASEPVEEITEEAAGEVVDEELIEGETPDELKIVVTSDELKIANAPETILDSVKTDDEMDYNGDGEVTLDEKLRYMEEQNSGNSLPQMTIESAQDKTQTETTQAAKVKMIEIPEQKSIEVLEQKSFEAQAQNSAQMLKQNNMFNQNQLTNTQKFNYNNLQKAYMTQPQTQQSFITRVA